MDYITINGERIPYPNDFTLTKVPYKAAELTTLTGTQIADVVGWRYDNTVMKWDTLLGSDLNKLLAALEAARSGDGIEITFHDMDGEHTERAVLESRVSTKTQYKYKGNIVWSGIEAEFSFPQCHRE